MAVGETAGGAEAALVMRRIAEGVQEEMMVALLSALQAAAGSCAEICEERLRTLHFQMLKAFEEERRAWPEPPGAAAARLLSPQSSGAGGVREAWPRRAPAAAVFDAEPGVLLDSAPLENGLGGFSASSDAPLTFKSVARSASDLLAQTGIARSAATGELSASMREGLLDAASTLKRGALKLPALQAHLASVGVRGDHAVVASARLAEFEASEFEVLLVSELPASEVPDVDGIAIGMPRSLDEFALDQAVEEHYALPLVQPALRAPQLPGENRAGGVACFGESSTSTAHWPVETAAAAAASSQQVFAGSIITEPGCAFETVATNAEASGTCEMPQPGFDSPR